MAIWCIAIYMTILRSVQVVQIRAAARTRLRGLLLAAGTGHGRVIARALGERVLLPLPQVGILAASDLQQLRVRPALDDLALASPIPCKRGELATDWRQRRHGGPARVAAPRRTSFSTRIWSALMMVDRRCAIVSAVRSLLISAREAWIWRSVSVSSADVASSNRTILGFCHRTTQFRPPTHTHTHTHTHTRAESESQVSLGAGDTLAMRRDTGARARVVAAARGP